jgi:hypothetical protein
VSVLLIRRKCRFFNGGRSKKRRTPIPILAATTYPESCLHPSGHSTPSSSVSVSSSTGGFGRERWRWRCVGWPEDEFVEIEVSGVWCEVVEERRTEERGEKEGERMGEVEVEDWEMRKRACCSRLFNEQRQMLRVCTTRRARGTQFASRQRSERRMIERTRRPFLPHRPIRHAPSQRQPGDHDTSSRTASRTPPARSVPKQGERERTKRAIRPRRFGGGGRRAATLLVEIRISGGEWSEKTKGSGTHS